MGSHAAGSNAAAGSQATPASHAAAGKPSLWRRFRDWRRSRPFVAGLLSLLAGAEILATVSAPLPVVVHIGLLGVIGFAVPILMILCALMLWFAPHPRVFYASLILVLSLASWITSNLGGFFLGLILGVVGGSFALAWGPRTNTA
jgi:hypothetical protein